MSKDIFRACAILRNEGISKAIPSFCTSNMLVIEAILTHYLKSKGTVLLESTSNQVNQFGGYTGMRPVEYRKHVLALADKVGFDKSRLAFGGDHLGPLPWANLPAKEAMDKACDLVREYVMAGYSKIHLDTSVKLADDQSLTDECIAQRGALLYKVCCEAQISQSDMELSFVIGSEVPPAGGSAGNSVIITTREGVENTIKAYKNAFAEINCNIESVIALVIQPGVEYSRFTIHEYDRKKASSLMNVLRNYKNISFEGHSTDFQPAEKLRQMAEDGIAILKVGPALTFALRETLFRMCALEQEFLPKEKSRSAFTATLLSAMESHPEYWDKYYSGNQQEVIIQQCYSYFDRCRYYFTDQAVQKSLFQLLDNFNTIEIPASVIQHFFPMQYRRLYINGHPCDAKSIIFDSISLVLEDYDYAAAPHVIGEKTC